jgi:hypothetical protein
MMTVLKSAGMLGMCLGLAALVVWTTGCSSEQPAAAPAAQDQTSAATEHGDQMADHGDEMTMETSEQCDAAKIKASFASLSPEDRELAMKQKTCPVSGELLGLMATPIKVDVEGHTVFICCPSCKDPLLEKPDEYLAKLGMKPATE